MSAGPNAKPVPTAVGSRDCDCQPAASPVSSMSWPLVVLKVKRAEAAEQGFVKVTRS